MRIVIELKREATPEIVLNQLYKHTPLQSSFGVINLAIVEGQPVILTLKDLLSHFLNHRRDVVLRRTQFELRKAEERMHILEGFKIALANLDQVIALIKGSTNPAEARTGLMEQYQLSAEQAQAILDLRLQKLTGMERMAIEKEHEELGKEIVRLKEIIGSSKKVDQIITAELTEVREKYGDKRRTEIVDDGGEIIIEDLIEDEPMVISVSHKGYIKRTALKEYREQRRGGKGVFGAAATDDDFVSQLFVASARTELMIFTSDAKVYRKKVYEIPEAGRTARGRNVKNILNLGQEEELTAILPIEKFEEDKYLLMVTQLGNIKRSRLMDYSTARQAGLKACKLRPGDRLISVKVSSGSDDVVISSNIGRAARFIEADATVQGRVSQGVRGIKLPTAGRVVGMALVSKTAAKDDVDLVTADGTLLTVCAGGYGKRTSISEYPVNRRGAQGVIDIKTNERNGEVIGILSVNDDSQIMLITSAGKIIRMRAGDVSVVGRNTMGVRLVTLDEGERVQAVARIRESDQEEAE
jgi:DNA gyrase subunit A